MAKTAALGKKAAGAKVAGNPLDHFQAGPLSYLNYNAFGTGNPALYTNLGPRYQKLYNAVSQLIQQMNQQMASGSGAPFLPLHRELWNLGQQIQQVVSKLELDKRFAISEAKRTTADADEVWRIIRYENDFQRVAQKYQALVSEINRFKIQPIQTPHSVLQGLQAQPFMQGSSFQPAMGPQGSFQPGMGQYPPPQAFAPPPQQQQYYSPFGPAAQQYAQFQPPAQAFAPPQYAYAPPMTFKPPQAPVIGNSEAAMSPFGPGTNLSYIGNIPVTAYDPSQELLANPMQAVM
jgi:hypothetical protein